MISYLTNNGTKYDDLSCKNALALITDDNGESCLCRK